MAAVVAPHPTPHYLPALLYQFVHSSGHQSSKRQHERGYDALDSITTHLTNCMFVSMVPSNEDEDLRVCACVYMHKCVKLIFPPLHSTSTLV